SRRAARLVARRLALDFRLLRRKAPGEFGSLGGSPDPLARPHRPRSPSGALRSRAGGGLEEGRIGVQIRRERGPPKSSRLARRPSRLPAAMFSWAGGSRFLRFAARAEIAAGGGWRGRVSPHPSGPRQHLWPDPTRGPVF